MSQVIRRTWGEYRLAMLVWLGTAAASIALVLLGLVLGVVALALAAGTLLFALAAGGRATGMVYQSCREQLGWYI